MTEDRHHHEAACEDARNAAITRTVEELPTSDPNWRVGDHALRSAAIEANARRQAAPPMRENHLEIHRRLVENARKLAEDTQAELAKAELRYARFLEERDGHKGADAGICFAFDAHGLLPSVRARIEKAHELYPGLRCVLQTRDGCILMASSKQFSAAIAKRKTVEFASCSTAEVLLMDYPDQSLDNLVPPKPDRGFSFSGEIGSESALSEQIGGQHYKTMSIQPVEFIEKNQIPYLEGNAIKYICRHASKGGAQDLDKAIHYLQLLKEMRYGDSK